MRVIQNTGKRFVTYYTGETNLNLLNEIAFGEIPSGCIRVEFNTEG